MEQTEQNKLHYEIKSVAGTERSVWQTMTKSLINGKGAFVYTLGHDGEQVWLDEGMSSRCAKRNSFR